MPRVEYSQSELQSLGLQPKRRHPRQIKKSPVPPAFWILGLAIILSISTLLVHQPVSIMGQPGGSSTIIEANGTVAQTTVMPDGNQTTLKIQNSGWPVSYYTISCYGVDPECKDASQLNVVSAFANLVFWLLVVLAARFAYVALVFAFNKRHH